MQPAQRVQSWGGHAVRGAGHAPEGLIIGAPLALQWPQPLRPAQALDPKVQASPLASRVRDGFDDLVGSMVPVVGNPASNTMIAIVGLIRSVGLAGALRVWLVAIRELEYFLHAQTVGSRIRAKAWEILVATLLIEARFGLARLVSARVIYAQAQANLRTGGWLWPPATARSPLWLVTKVVPAR